MIGSVILEGFQGHISSHLEFSPGVNVVVGEGDVGKTAVMRAVRWALENRPAGDGFVYRGSRKKLPCRVTIKTARGDTIIRERKPKNRYVVNETEFTTVGRTVPDEVRAVLDLQPINVQGQLIGQYFLVLDSPGEISRYLSDLYHFDAATVASQQLKEGAHRATRQQQDLVTKQHQLTQTLTAYEPLSELEAPIELAEQSIAEVEEAKQQQVRLQTLLNQLDTAEQDAAVAARLAQQDTSRLTQYATLLDSTLTRRTQLAEQLQRLQRSRQQAATQTTAVEQASRNVTEAVMKYEEILRRTATCPTCLRPMSEDVVSHMVHEVAA